MKLLLLLCLLSPWLGSASAQETRPGVVTVAEDADALLPCSLGPDQKIDKFDWKKDDGEYGKKEVFFYDGGSHYNNGRPGQDEQFKGRVEFFKDGLESGNASIKIKSASLEDNGTYTCVLFEPNRQEFDIRLNVGAAPLPYVKSAEEEKSWSLLQCKVEGAPKPEVQWTNSAGKPLLSSAEDLNVIESQSGRFSVELKVNVTSSDKYTCVATQRDIFHQINNTLAVYIQETTKNSEFPTGLVVGLSAVVCLLLICLLLVVVYFLRCRKSEVNGREDKNSEQMPDGQPRQNENFLPKST